MNNERFLDGPSPYKYDLTEFEIDSLEGELAYKINEEMHLGDGVYSSWLNHDSQFSNIARSNEIKHWPYMQEIMNPHEQQSKFLMLFDTREGLNSAIHFTRISSISNESMKDESETTGLIIIDDIINSDQGLSAKGFRDYYANKGVDLRKCITVETNIKVKNVQTYNSLNTADLAYLSMFKYVKDLGAEEGKACVFAVINLPTIKSFGRIGLNYENLSGIPNLRTPSTPGSFDDNFVPVAIPYDAESIKLFKSIEELGAKDVNLN